MRYVECCEKGEWHLQIWNPLDPKQGSKRIPFRCRSWRHAGPCAMWKGSQDFARCQHAIAQTTIWTYIVLTFDQNNWEDPWQQYKQGVTLWSRLRKRITRKFGMVKYIQTWERHQKGGAHVNVLASCWGLFQAVQHDWRRVRNSWLEPNAVACGFGMRTWIENMRGGGVEVAGYLTKLSRELTCSSPKSQTPLDAAKHFRRLRASRGVLPPPWKSEMTGKLWMCPIHGFPEQNHPNNGKTRKSKNAGQMVFD